MIAWRREELKEKALDDVSKATLGKLLRETG